MEKKKRNEWMLKCSSSSPQIEAIFELGDVDGDGEIDMGEFVGVFLFS